MLDGIAVQGKVAREDTERTRESLTVWLRETVLY